MVSDDIFLLNDLARACFTDVDHIVSSLRADDDQVRALLVESTGVQRALVFARHFELGVRPLTIEVARDLAEEGPDILAYVPFVLATLLLAFLDLFLSVLDDARMTLIEVDSKHVDGVPITAAGQPLRALVNSDTVDVCFLFASAQLLDALTRLGVENSNQCSLL